MHDADGSVVENNLFLYVNVALALEVGLARGMVYRHVLVCCGSLVAANLNRWLCLILAEA
jgi:hypothetical protein